MRSTVVTAALGLGLFAFGSQASAQIIATSIPKEVSAPAPSGPAGSVAPAAGEKKVAFHVAAMYGKWDYAFGFEGLTVGLKPNSFLGAGEVAIAATENISLGLGGWYNQIAKTDAELTFDGDRIVVPDVDMGSMWELHGAVFYKSIGVQGGLIGWGGEDSGDIPKDKDLYGVFKMGKDRWTLSLGAGGYKYGGEAGSWAPSGFAAASLQLAKGFGVDASYWYIGETDDIDLSFSRLSVGVGYTFSR